MKCNYCNKNNYSFRKKLLSNMWVPIKCECGISQLPKLPWFMLLVLFESILLLFPFFVVSCFKSSALIWLILVLVCFAIAEFIGAMLVPLTKEVNQRKKTIYVMMAIPWIILFCMFYLPNMWTAKYFLGGIINPLWFTLAGTVVCLRLFFQKGALPKINAIIVLLAQYLYCLFLFSLSV